MGPQEPHIYRLPLQKFDSSYFADKYSDLFKTDTTKKKEKVVTVQNIDASRIMDRIEPVGPSFSSQYMVSIVQKDDKTTVLFLTDQVEGKPALYKTDLKPFEDSKTDKITGAEGFDAGIVQSGEKLYLLNKGTLIN
jgi:hypothetical protein